MRLSVNYAHHSLYLEPAILSFVKLTGLGKAYCRGSGCHQEFAQPSDRVSALGRRFAASEHAGCRMYTKLSGREYRHNVAT